MYILFYLSVEDQKELPSTVNPELRHKEVQMNFFNQLTSVFNPDLTSILSFPSAAHMHVGLMRMAVLSSPVRSFVLSFFCSFVISIKSVCLNILSQLFFCCCCKYESELCFLKSHRLRVKVTTKPQIKPFRSK